MGPLFNMEDYTVAWLAPLDVEAAAALQLLDEHHGSPPRRKNQTISYHLGRMGAHNVAIAGFPAGQVGIGVAGTMAAEMKRDLPNLEIGLLVGIGAGIPSTTNDIHLGDVAIAVPDGDKSGVVGYDMVKIEREEVHLKQWQNSSSPTLRSAISHMKALSMAFDRKCNFLLTHLERFKNTKFERPQAASHPPTCVKHAQQPREYPLVHHGTILSGNKVIKSEEYRDEINRRYNAIAIEMEAAGIMNALPVAVIRGISDFGDSAKDDEWKPYAAATAAAYAKELLRTIGPIEAVDRVPKARYVGTGLSHSDLMNVLEDRSRRLNVKYNWRFSVVDLLKLLNLDSSPEARSRLAQRWNIFQGEDGDPVRNIALYRAIMDALSKSHGDVPASLARSLSVDG